MLKCRFRKYLSLMFTGGHITLSGAIGDEDHESRAGEFAYWPYHPVSIVQSLWVILFKKDNDFKDYCYWEFDEKGNLVRVDEDEK